MDPLPMPPGATPCSAPKPISPCCSRQMTPLGDGPLPPAADVGQWRRARCKDAAEEAARRANRTSYPVCHVRRVDGVGGFLGLPLFELALYGADGLQRSSICVGARWVVETFPELLPGNPEPAAAPPPREEPAEPVPAPGPALRRRPPVRATLLAAMVLALAATAGMSGPGPSSR